MKQSYVVHHGPQEPCVQLFDEQCFPEEGFCEECVTLNRFSFSLAISFFYAIIEQAVSVHSECGIFNAKEKYCTFSSHAHTTCRVFFVIL